jgi:ferrochelatase
LFSFHGLPKRNLLAGDPYHCECHKTARLVAERLKLAPERWGLSFQSRFGKAEWLKPYTSELLKEWAEAGVSSVDVVCPGFAADCLETLEEIELENREYFLAAGGQRYRYIPALNDDPLHIEALTRLIVDHSRGWPELDADAIATDTDAAAGRERALALGAAR